MAPNSVYSSGEAIYGSTSSYVPSVVVGVTRCILSLERCQLGSRSDYCYLVSTLSRCWKHTNEDTVQDSSLSLFGSQGIQASCQDCVQYLCMYLTSVPSVDPLFKIFFFPAVASAQSGHLSCCPGADLHLFPLARSCARSRLRDLHIIIFSPCVQRVDDNYGWNKLFKPQSSPRATCTMFACTVLLATSSSLSCAASARHDARQHSGETYSGGHSSKACAVDTHDSGCICARTLSCFSAHRSGSPSVPSSRRSHHSVISSHSRSARPCNHKAP